MQLLISDIAVIIIAAALFGFLFRLFRQPIIIAYIVAGFIIGPFGLNYIGNENTILAISELGITFLLFLVGIELNINHIREVGKVVLFGGMMQVALTAFFGGILSFFIGFSPIESFYLGLVLAFSSTLVVIKHLSDNKEISTIHGRIMIGILVLQDIVAIMIVTMLPSLTDLSFGSVGKSVLSGLSLLVLAYVTNRIMLRKIFDFAAKTPELLFLASLAVCFIFSYLATIMGLSASIGAFLAGVIIANLPYSTNIVGKIKPLTTFFSALFFVGLGMQIVPGSIPNIIFPLAILVGMALFLKPLLMFPIVYYFGYDRKTAFLISATMAQVSEFSLIVVAQGVILAHLTPDILSLVIFLTSITMGLSSYLSNNGLDLFHKYSHNLDFIDRIFQRRKSFAQESMDAVQEAQVIINGYENMSGSILESFMNKGKKVLIVDNDPQIIRQLRDLKVNCMYGDLAQSDVLENIDLSKVEVVMSTVPAYADSLIIVQKFRQVGRKSVLIMTANKVSESFALYNAGADYVVIPHIEGEKQMAYLLEDFNTDVSKVLSKKLEHIAQLKKRQILKEQFNGGHENFMQDIDAMVKNIADIIIESRNKLKRPEHGKVNASVAAKKKALHMTKAAMDAQQPLQNEDAVAGKEKEKAGAEV